MKTERVKPLIEIVAFTDPYCTWCWGSEPILGKIEVLYGEQVQISYRMGGLVEDIATFRDGSNAIGGSNYFEQVAAHWADAATRHGMPVDAEGYLDFRDDFRSTWPASIAYEAAVLQGRSQGNRYLRAMRIAAAAERRGIHRRTVQEQVAEETGLDMGQFRSSLDTGRAELAFNNDLAECRQRGIHSFPSYLLRNGEGDQALLPGFNTFEKIDLWLQELSSTPLVQREVSFGLTEVHRYLSTKPKVALREIEEIFAVGHIEASQFMQHHCDSGMFQSQPAGSGNLYSLNTAGAACDLLTGTCG